MNQYALLPLEASRNMLIVADAAVFNLPTHTLEQRKRLLRRVWAVMAETAQQEIPAELRPGALMQHMEGE